MRTPCLGRRALLRPDMADPQAQPTGAVQHRKPAANPHKRLASQRPPPKWCLTAPDGEATAQPRLPSPTEAAVAPIRGKELGRALQPTTYTAPAGLSPMRWVPAVGSRQLGTQQPYGRSGRRQSVVSIGVTQNAATVTGTAASDTIYCSGANLGQNDQWRRRKRHHHRHGVRGQDQRRRGQRHGRCGVIGNDILNGGVGDDTMTGAGNDKLTGGDGDDTITGSEGDDTLTGDANDDTRCRQRWRWHAGGRACR